MKLIHQILLGKLAGLVAPIVCLVYRKGIWVTPDDPVSPFGCGTTPGASNEQFMQKLYAKAGTFVGDYWWCGWRNRAYGLAYKFKPDFFKNLTTYVDLKNVWVDYKQTWYGRVRTIHVEGYKEVTYMVGGGKLGFHVITGYRLRPVFDTWYDARFNHIFHEYRPINMDARPIASIRWGANDD